MARSVGTIYDLLDLIRGIEVYLNTIPGASPTATVWTSAERQMAGGTRMDTYWHPKGAALESLLVVPI